MGECCVNDYTVNDSSKDDIHHRYEESNIINIRLKPHVASCILHFNRVIMMKLKRKHFFINIIQVYPPTNAYSNDEVEKLYSQIDEVF